MRHQYNFNLGSKTGTNIDYFHNGKIKTREQLALNGIDSEVDEYDSAGRKIFEKNFREGRPHGFWYFYGADGKTLSLKETYKDGQLNGLRTSYHPNGEKKVEETWKYNLIMGPVKNFYENGKLLSNCEFRASRMHGDLILVIGLTEMLKSRENTLLIRNTRSGKSLMKRVI